MDPCIRLMDCPTPTNPFDFLKIFGLLYGAPLETGLLLLVGVILGAVYIRTQSLTYVAVPLLIIGFTLTGYSLQTQQVLSSLFVAVILIVAGGGLLVVARLKNEV